MSLATRIALIGTISGGTGGGGPPGTGSTLTPWTITEQGGISQTNVPIDIYIPFSAAGGAVPFANTDAIQILDADGITVIPCQEDNRSSDLSSNVRGLKITAILPSLAANQARQLTIQKVAATPPGSGMDIAIAEILATGYDCAASMAYKDGNTYTASGATALGSGIWSSKTTAANQGKWRTGGGFVTEYICFSPFARSGTPTPNNLGMWFSVSAYKAQTGSVSGGNPIIAIQTKYWIECGYIQITPNTARSHWFDLTVTSGGTVQSWVGSTPAKVLTLSGNGPNNTTVTATVPAGGATFTQASVGMVIGDGIGAALITAYTNATTVSARICTTMSGTSIASGTWRIFGLNHEYASALPQQEIWYNGGLAINAKPPLDSSLGVAWNTGTLTGGPFSYYSSTGMVLPYTTVPSAISNSLTNLNSCLPNPTGMNPGSAGDIVLYMPTTGGRDDIAPIPGWYVGAMIRWDSNAKSRIFGDALKMALCPIFYRDQTTGKAMLFNNGTDYVYNPEFGSHTLPRTSPYYYGTDSISAWGPQIAHHPNCFYIPWLLTGDYFWAEKMQQQMFWIWSETPGNYGSQLSRLCCNCDELRGNGWNYRDLMSSIVMTPDRNPTMLGYSRAHLQTLYDNQFTATGSGTAGVNPQPGVNIGLINNTGVGKVYAAAGFRGMVQVNSGSESQWQLGYMTLAFFLGKGMGMTSAYAEAFMTWFMEGLTGAATNASVVPNWIVPVYYANTEDQAGNFVNDWAGVYKTTAQDLTQTGSNRRIVTGTGITISALSGSGITSTMPGGYFTTGGSAFYTGSFVRDNNAASLQIVPTVVAGGTGYAVNDTINVTVSGASGAFTVSRIAQLKVATVSGSAVATVTINDPGLYIANTAADYGSTGTSLTQAATSGGGSGATFTASAPDLYPPPIRFGMGKVTNVATNTLTLTTTGSCHTNGGQEYCYPFAQLSFVTNRIQVSAPYPGDSNGSGTTNAIGPFMPIPYSSQYEYWDIALQCSVMANVYGYANGSAAHTYISTNYTGPCEVKWKLS